MDVVLDTSVFLNDIMLTTRKSAMTLDYLEAVDSKILLLEPIETEIVAAIPRIVDEIKEKLTSASKNMERLGVIIPPELTAAELAEIVLSSWGKRVGELEKSLLLMRVPYSGNPSVLSEAVKRAANRMPPCKKTGAGARDAVIWLETLKFLEDESRTDQLAFVSNDKDFQHSSLKREAAASSPPLLLFPGLFQFNRDQAIPVKGIDFDWIRSHMTESNLAIALREVLLGTNSQEHFRIRNPQIAPSYVVIDVLEIEDVEYKIDDFFMRELIDKSLSFGISMDATIVAKCVCGPRFPEFHHDVTIAPPSQIELCTAEMYVSGYALKQNDGIGQFEVASFSDTGPAKMDWGLGMKTEED